VKERTIEEGEGERGGKEEGGIEMKISRM